MKLSTVGVLLACLMASTLAFTEFSYGSEYDLIEDLKDRDGKIYLLFFYASINLTPMGYETYHHHYHQQADLEGRNN